MEITICGSLEFSPQIIEIKKELEKKGHKINIPYFTQKIMDGELTLEEFMKTKKENGGDIKQRQAIPVDFIKRYWNYIKNSNAILVLNQEKKEIKNYIGGNTLIEMGFAYGHEKKIYLYNELPKKSEIIHYLDELIDLKPIIINQDLNKII